MSRVLALAALLAGAAPALAVGPGAAISADLKLIFVPAKGGIEAINLETGKTLWSNTGAANIAGVSSGAVFAWGAGKKANEFVVFAFDGATGKPLGKSDPIEMPDWATTERVHGRTFALAVRGDGEAAHVAWKAGAFYAGGAAPTREILAAAKKDAGGVVAVLFAKGKVTVAKDKSADDVFKAAAPKPTDPKVGYAFRINEEVPGFKPGAPMLTKVTLTVTKDGKDLWSRELPGNPWSPPPP